MSAAAYACRGSAATDVAQLKGRCRRSNFCWIRKKGENGINGAVEANRRSQVCLRLDNQYTFVKCLAYPAIMQTLCSYAIHALF
jgi:hypothetical protein